MGYDILSAFDAEIDVTTAASSIDLNKPLRGTLSDQALDLNMEIIKFLRECSPRGIDYYKLNLETKLFEIEAFVAMIQELTDEDS